jgi:hypothetical protein
VKVGEEEGGKKRTKGGRTVHKVKDRKRCEEENRRKTLTSGLDGRSTEERNKLRKSKWPSGRAEKWLKEERKETNTRGRSEGQNAPPLVPAATPTGTRGRGGKHEREGEN